MKVLYFHQHFTTPDGSGGTRSYEFARALVARGHRVTMVCGRSDRSDFDLPWVSGDRWHRGTIDGIDVIALPVSYANHDGILRRTWLFLRYALRSTMIALRFDYDLLYATSTPLTAALPGIIARRWRRGIRYVFEVRDLWPELPRALGMRNPVLLGGMSLLEWLAYRHADACVGLSPGIVEGIRRRAPAGCPIVMIPNGCDLDLFAPTERRPLDLPGIAPTDFVAGFVGAHGIANGLDAVLDAGEELKRLGRGDIKLVLIGGGNQKDRLMRRARDERLDNVLFFPPVRKTEIARLTASFDCGLMILADVPAFYYGTSPNKFFDYVSAGLPVINNYPGWLADIIQEANCGLAVPPRSRQSFAGALIWLADHKDDRQSMARNARLLAEDKFNRHQLAAEWYEQVINPAP